MQMDGVKKAFFLCGLCLCLVTGVLAEEEANQDNKWGGDAGMGLALSRGNTETTNLSLALSVKGPLSESLSSTTSVFFLFSKEKNITNAESLGLESRIDWQLSERFFSYVDILGLRDRFKNYSYRILPSAGVGYKVVTTEKIQLSASAGLSGSSGKPREKNPRCAKELT